MYIQHEAIEAQKLMVNSPNHTVVYIPFGRWACRSPAPSTPRRRKGRERRRGVWCGGEVGSMTRRLRRDIRLLQAYATVSSLLLVWLAVSAFRQPNVAPGGQKIDELTVQRLNVAMPTARSLGSCSQVKDRMHPGILDGKVIERRSDLWPGSSSSTTKGDEVGGLTITGQDRDGVRRATRCSPSISSSRIKRWPSRLQRAERSALNRADGLGSSRDASERADRAS